MRKVTLAFAMLPLLASAPVLAAGSAGMATNARGVNMVSSGGLVQLAQAGDPGSQQACELARQNAQSYARILQLRDKMVRIQRENEARFRALEKGKGGGGGVAVGSTAILDEAMRDNGGGSAGQNGMYAGQGAAVQMELLRNLTGKIEDVDAQIADTDSQLQKTQEDNEFRFQELEKSKGIASPKGGAGQTGQASAAAAGDLCAQGITGVSDITRVLGSRAEAMTFQILEMQDQMQKMQEDNERRFQNLEGGRADAGGEGGTSVAAAAPDQGNAGAGSDVSGDVPDTAPAQQAAGGAPGADSVAIGSSAPDQGGPMRGEPPQMLGSIRFDANGNVIGETVNATPRAPEQGSQPGATAGGQQAGGNVVASLPTDDNPNALYQSSYQYLMAGDYKAAETGFRQHVKRYPADPMTAEARFWLGESLYGQGRYPEAATVFIDTQRDYPDSKRGAENMFKLGMTLEKMDNHDVACATFAQIPQRYPKAAPAILKRVADERTRVKC